MADADPPPAPTIGTLNQAQSIDQSRHSGVDVGDHANISGTIVGGDYYAAPDPLRALHQLPAPAGDFVGRADEIAQVTAALRRAAAGGGAAAISGLQGLGGIGKTALALVAAHAVAADFPDAQLVLDLRGASATPLPPAAALQTALRAFAPEARLSDDLTELQGLYRAALSGKRALILADDAADAAQVRPLLPPPGCALLITSRQHFTLPGMDDVRLNILPADEAAELVHDICKRLDAAAAARLAQLCGGLPLALRVSASLLAADPTRPIARYLDQLAQTRLALLQDPDADPNDPHASVAASLRLSWAALAAGDQVVLAACSVFAGSFDLPAANAVLAPATAAGAPAPMPPGVEALAGRATPAPPAPGPRSLQTPGVQASAGPTEPTVEERLGRLYRRSLLDYDASTARYSLHDLVRAFAAEQGADLEPARLRHAQHYAAVVGAASELYNRGGEGVLAGLALFDWERTEIDAGWAWARAQADARPDVDELLLAYADGTAYIGDLRYAKRTERIPQLEAALAATRRLGRRDAEGRCLGKLGSAHADLGEAQRAIGYHEQALALAREIGNRQGEGADLGNLGVAYVALGEVRRAIGFYEQALAIHRATGDRRGVAVSLSNLGSAYYRLGEWRRAIDFSMQALTIIHALGDREGEGHVLDGLGSAYAALGDVRRAIGYYKQHLVLARALGDHRAEGGALGNLGVAYKNLGEAQQAIGYYEQQLLIVREIEDRRGEATCLGNLGVAYFRLGRVRRATGFYEQGLTIAREIGDRRGEGQNLGNLGNAYAALGEVRRAIGYYEQALVIDRAIGDRQGEGQNLGNLGGAYAALGEWRQAVGYYEQALLILRAIGDRRGEGAALGNLGNAYAALGEGRRAIRFYEQALALAREIEDRRGEASSSWNLGLVLEQEGDLAGAIAAMQVCVDYERKIGHPAAAQHAVKVKAMWQRLVRAAGGAVAGPEQD